MVAHPRAALGPGALHPLDRPRPAAVLAAPDGAPAAVLVGATPGAPLGARASGPHGGRDGRAPRGVGAASSAPTPRHPRWLAVAAVAETWRVDEGWWRGADPPEADEGRAGGNTGHWPLATGHWPRGISRLYFAVVLEDGRALTLFQDLLEGEWYVQGRGECG